MATQFFKTTEGTIAYDDMGSGQLIICVPSMGDLRQEYRFIAPKLVAAGYHVITMDVRGHGESSTTWSDFSVAGVGSDILALIKHVNAGSAIVLGDSMAAGAAVWAAVEQTNLISGLVLMGAFVRNAPLPAYMSFIMRLMFARPWGAASWGMYFSTLFPTNKPADFASYRQQLLANLRQPGRLEALQSMLAAPKVASEKRANQVKVPTLIVMGTKDPDFKDPVAEAKWLAEQTGGKVIMVEGAEHYPHVEMIDQTAQPIINFLESIKVK